MTARLLALELLALAAFSVAWSAWVGSGVAGFVEEKLRLLMEILR